MTALKTHASTYATRAREYAPRYLDDVRAAVADLQARGFRETDISNAIGVSVESIRTLLRSARIASDAIRGEAASNDSRSAMGITINRRFRS